MADPTPADLRDLEKAARKLIETQRDLREAVGKTTSAMGIFSGRATTSLAGVAALESQISNLMKSVAPLEAAMASVNGALGATAALSRSSGDALADFAKMADSVGQALSDVAKQHDALDKSQTRNKETARLSADEVKKLGGSLKSTFDALASGADPFKVFIEQGPGIAQIFADAAKSGVGLKGVLLGIGETIAPMLLPFAAVAAVAATIAAPFAIGAASINQANKDITAGLGLTAEQLSNVKDKSVTMGDVATATFEVLGDKLKSAFGPSIGQAGEDFQSFLAGLAKPAAEAVANVIAAFAGAFAAIKATWAMLPAALGDIIYSGANLLIAGVEKMINGVIALANGMITSVNGIAKKLGLSISLPELSDVHIQRLNNRYEGAAKAVGDVANKAFKQTFKNVHDGVIDIFGDIAAKSVEVAQERIRKSVPKSEKRGGAGAKAGDVAVSRDYGDVAYKEPVSVVQDRPIDGPRPAAFNVEGVKPFIDPISKSFDELIEKLTDINALAPELGKQFEAAFGKTGKALGGVMTSFSAYSLEVAKIDSQAAGRTPTAEEQAKRDQARVKGYEAMAGAAKGFFKEGSAGYKAMQVAEIAFHTIETLNTIKSMALRGADTASAVAAEVPKQAAYGATAYAKTLGSVPFPFNLLAGATVLAALVQVGVAIKGKPSGGSVPGVNDMKTRQDAQGTGSSLGDSKAKSDSLEKAVGYAEAYQNKDLEYGNDMVRSLKSIDGQIGAVAAALARSFGAGGMLSTEGLSLGKTGASASLSNLGFSKSTTRTLQDQGIQFDAATLADITDGKLSGSTYQQVLETTKKKAFGIATSNKSKVITETGALDTDFVDQVSKLVRSLGKGVADAAKALGETDVESVLAKFKVDLGKLSFKDMTGTQIEEALNAIFGKLGDDMAKAAVPVIAEFQKVGEGGFETLVRVARQYEVIDTTLKSVGMKFNDVGVASLAARERLVDLVGGLDNLTEQTSFFGENFLTDKERLKPVKDTVNDKLTELRLPTNMTREGFKNLVLGLDVSTREGAELYAAMMALAPAFDKVATAAEATKSAVDDKAKSIQDRIDDLIMTPAQKLAKSRTAEEDAVKALDASLLPLLKSLWAVEDAAQASAAAIEKEAKDKAMAASRSGALADLLDAQGYAEQAKKIRRDLALADVEDAVQQDYMRRTWAAQDAAEKVSAARDVLTQAYQREQDAIQATKDKFKELSASLRAFSGSLTETIAGTDPAMRYRRSREAFMSTAAMARLGDPDAMGRLQSEGEAFTAASRDYVSTSLDYLRDVGLVRSAVDEAADTADRQVSIAQRQLDALDASVQGLIEINTNVVSVRQAIIALQAANAQARDAGVVSVGGIPIPGALTGPPNTGTPGTGAPVTSNKTLDGLYYYDPMIATAAYAESLRDPQYWANGNPYEKPGTQEYSTLQTLKAKDPQKYSELEYMHTLQRLATGGSFEVGGSGPPDSKFFGLALSPGEAVNVQRADQKNDRGLINELRNLRAELADLRASNARIAASNDKMERTLTNVTEGGRAMQTQAAA